MAEITIEPSTDSGMNGHHPDTNYGASTGTLDGVIFLGEEKSDLWRAIGNFDVSQLAGTVINGAKLVRQITHLFGTGPNATVYRCTKPTLWTEDGVTWNKYDGVNAWDSAGGDYDPSFPTPVGYTEPSLTGQHQITGLEEFVEDALENRDGILSIIIRADDEGAPSSQAVLWATRESTTEAWRWKLVIDYQPITTRPRRRAVARTAGKRPLQPRVPRPAVLPRTPSTGLRPRSSRGAAS